MHPPRGRPATTRAGDILREVPYHVHHVLGARASRVDGNTGKGPTTADSGGVGIPGKRTLTEQLQRKALGTSPTSPNADAAVSRAASAGGGAVPDAGVKSKVERATGADLADVRVHTGGEDAAEQEADRVATAALSEHHAGPIRQQATGLAREPTTDAGAGSLPAERGFTRRTREVISNAATGMEAWNGTYAWDSKMHLAIQPGQLTVTVRIFTSAPPTNRTQWAQAIADKWSRRMDLHVLRGAHPGRYQIIVGVQWVDRARDADYTVRPNSPTGPTAGGRMGIGGTTSMTDWGTGDTTDVTHEFGHMLGNPEEYFTTNGVDYTGGGARRGFRDPGAGIMNNPADVPFERHYDTIRENAATMLDTPADGCVIEPHRDLGDRGDFPTTTNDGTRALA